MVGTDPSQPGAGTTTIPVELIPVAVDFSLVGANLSPENPACFDSVPIVDRVVASPLFNDAPWPSGDITQFVDAFQRANFWTLVSRDSPDYHVLLNVSVGPAIQLEAPLNSSLIYNPNAACPQPLAGVPIDTMNAFVESEISTLGITPNTLPIFLTYNTAFLLDSGGVYLGYHNTFGSQTFVVASYNDPGFNLYSYNASDIVVLSHELGEWMDDPFGTNQVPAWGQFGIQPTCGGQLEVGDPLTSSVYAYPFAGFGYHIQELAYFSWFAHNVPSLAINDEYSTGTGPGSLAATFTTYAPPCL